MQTSWHSAGHIGVVSKPPINTVIIIPLVLFEALADTEKTKTSFLL